MEGYYDGVIFHRVVKRFIVQGGDPSGTGLGGESIYGEPFRDEFHSRLRFVRRGLLGMANAGRDDNRSQFFFTLSSTPELQNKHTIFAKVTGNTLYNMLKLEDSLVDRNEKPLEPHKIISTKILLNPYDDIIPREKKNDKKQRSDEPKSKSRATKDFKLLSFGDEAEEEEEEMEEAVREFKGKSKSSHDLLQDDPKLSSIPAVDVSTLSKEKDPDDEDRKSRRRRKKEKKAIKNKYVEDAEVEKEKEIENLDTN